MLVWLRVNLHEFYEFPVCIGQYVGIRLGRAGHSGQLEAAWEAEGCFLRLETFLFFQSLLQLGVI